MAQYREPSVEITQVQETVTVNAAIADLMSGVIGPAYDVVNLGDFVYPWFNDATGSPLGITFTVSGIEADDPIKTLEEASIYVEMVSKTNEIIPFTGDIDYDSATNELTLTGPGPSSIVTILSKFDPSTPASLRGYRPKVAYRALYTDRAKEMFLKTTEDVVTSVGKIAFENPLGFAAGLMLQNNPNEFMVFPVKSNDQAGYTEAMDSLDNSSVYAFAVLNQDKVNILSSFITWITDRSLPENGKPSKLYMSPLTTWYDASGNTGTDVTGNQLGVTAVGFQQKKFSFIVDQLPRTYKNYTAQNIAASNAQILNRRVTSVNPDLAWILHERHILQTDPTYTALISDVVGAQCVLADTLTLLDGEILHSGTIISSAIFDKLVDVTKYAKTTVRVWAPVAGYHLAVQQAALVSALVPSDPKTQFPVGGIHKISYSEQYFGREYTNVIAGGGTTVIIQPSLSVLPASRHHLTTDTSSTQTREDNIVHQVDIVTINYILTLKKLVGRYKQTPKFFKLLRATLSAYAEQFKLREYVKEIQILEVKQHPTELDKVVVILRLFPYYAVNYIDVTILY